jgi:hypothetical protein
MPTVICPKCYGSVTVVRVARNKRRISGMMDLPCIHPQNTDEDGTLSMANFECPHLDEAVHNSGV